MTEGDVVLTPLPQADGQVKNRPAPGDDMLLDVCLAGRADVLVTGDADLLSVDAEQLRAVGLASLRILTPRAYLAGARERM